MCDGSGVEGGEPEAEDPVQQAQIAPQCLHFRFDPSDDVRGTHVTDCLNATIDPRTVGRRVDQEQLRDLLRAHEAANTRIVESDARMEEDLAEMAE